MAGLGQHDSSMLARQVSEKGGFASWRAINVFNFNFNLFIQLQQITMKLGSPAEQNLIPC
jgi:hypothetical protein